MADQMDPKESESRLRALAQQLGAKACPVCGQPMREHFVDHSTKNAVLNCPVPHPGAWDRDAFEPVNELGMTINANLGHKRLSAG